jgi:uncharacterized protein (TIGR03086 family)
MTSDMLELYSLASDWTNEKVAGAVADLDASTPCDDWNVRTLLNHMLDTQRYFLSNACGEDAQPPAPVPPHALGEDPVNDFNRSRTEMLAAFSEPGVIEKTGPSLGIAFSDQLLHGWDLAKATGQDTTMPAGLAEAAYESIHGRFTDEQRKGLFRSEIAVADNASWQERLLAYSGRDSRRGT